MWRGLGAALLVACVTMAACFDFGTLGGGEGADGGGAGTGGCAANEKPCAGECVKVDDPAVGCSGACTACVPPANASAVCVLENGSFVCGSGACNLGYADCDGKPTNGCEVRATTPANCGSCGNDCGQQYCERQGDGFVCSPTCDLPNTTCSGDGGTGCVDLTSDPDNCGKCGVRCAEKDGYAICDNSVCLTGEANCDAGACDNGAGQCIPTDFSQSPNCGECNMDCRTSGLKCCKGRSSQSQQYTCGFPVGGAGDGGACNP